MNEHINSRQNETIVGDIQRQPSITSEAWPPSPPSATNEQGKNAVGVRKLEICYLAEILDGASLGPHLLPLWASTSGHCVQLTCLRARPTLSLCSAKIFLLRYQGSRRECYCAPCYVTSMVIVVWWNRSGESIMSASVTKHCLRFADVLLNYATWLIFDMISSLGQTLPTPPGK